MRNLLKLLVPISALAVFSLNGQVLAHTRSPDPLPGVLTVDQAVRLGIRRSTRIAEEQEGNDASLSTYLSSASPLPVMIGAGHQVGTSGTATLTGKSGDDFLDLSNTVDTSGQRRYLAASLHAHYRSDRYQYQELLVAIEQQIRDAYWTLAAAQSQTQIAILGYEEAEMIAELVAKPTSNDPTLLGDTLRSSISVANAKQTLISAQGAEASALASLNSVLNQPLASPIRLAANLTIESADMPTVDVPEIEVLNQRAIVNRPLLKASEEQVKAAQYGIRRAEAARLPDLTIDYQKSLVRGEFHTLLLSLNMPLIDFGSVRESIRAANQSRRQLETRYSATQKKIELQVAEARSALKQAVRAAKCYKAEILDPSSQLLESARLSYQKGTTTLLPVNEAELTARNARIGYVNCLLGIYKAQDAVWASVGHSIYVADEVN